MYGLTWIHGCRADGSGGAEWGRLNLDGKDNYIFLYNLIIL